MTRHAYAALLTIGAVVSGATSGHAQSERSCASHDFIVDRLATGYGETRQSIGLGSDNRIVELFASTQTGTWTLIITHPDGQTCLVAAGEAFEKVAETLPAKGDDA
jgi:hypothetical protein